MFIAMSVYLKSLEELDQLYPAHYEWLKKYYESGNFLGSGPRVPRIGGLLMARAESREEFLAILAEDPFHQNGFAQYDVFEFNPGPLPRRSADLEAFLSKQLGEEKRTSS